jgi:hypothetical protein
MIRLLIDNCEKISEDLYELLGYYFRVNFTEKNIMIECSVTQINICTLCNKEDLLRFITVIKSM